jgi:DNA-binding transcriptional ArsR family regulator
MQALFKVECLKLTFKLDNGITNTGCMLDNYLSKRLKEVHSMNSFKDAKINWEFGTAYDLFVSLYVLHNPERFSLRANWAAGVRSRLNPELRQTLEHARNALVTPIRFVFGMTVKNKNSASVIHALSHYPPLKRLKMLSDFDKMLPAYRDILQNTSPNKAWTEAEREILIEETTNIDRKNHPRYLESLYTIWSNPKEFGDLYLTAIMAYVDNFFAEEEQRILPALKQAQSYAQMRAGSLSLPLLLEELTSGVRYSELEQAKSLHLAPSFWAAPLMFSNRTDRDHLIILYGARPDNMAIIPGDPVPDSLMRGLKALADPTRLRIMRFLAQSPQTASQLSRSLRLRPPTVNHHLNELRIAGLVHIIISQEGERQFATRYDGVDAMHDLLSRYLHGI